MCAFNPSHFMLHKFVHSILHILCYINVRIQSFSFYVNINLFIQSFSFYVTDNVFIHSFTFYMMGSPHYTYEPLLIWVSLHWFLIWLWNPSKCSVFWVLWFCVASQISPLIPPPIWTKKQVNHLREISSVSLCIKQYVRKRFNMRNSRGICLRFLRNMPLGMVDY